MSDIEKLALKRVLELSEEVYDSVIDLVSEIKNPEITESKIYPIMGLLREINKWAKAVQESNHD